MVLTNDTLQVILYNLLKLRQFKDYQNSSGLSNDDIIEILNESHSAGLKSAGVELKIFTRNLCSQNSTGHFKLKLKPPYHFQKFSIYTLEV